MTTDFQTFIDLVFRDKTSEAQQGIKELDKQVRTLGEHVYDVEQQSKKLADTSTRAAAAGVLLLTPALLTAEKYLTAVGKTEQVSRRYFAAQARQQQAQIELGRKAAAALAPYQEALADLLEKISEVDPRIIEAGVAVGAGISLIGAMGVLTSQIGLFITSASKLILAITSAQGATALGAGGSAALYGGVGVAALAAGGYLGIQAVRQAGRSQGDERLADYGLDDIQETIKQLIFVLGDFRIQFQATAKTGFAILEFELKTGALKLSKELQNLIDTIVLGYLDFQEALAGIGFEKFGVKFDLGDLLGIDQSDLDQQRQAVADRRQSRPEDTEAADAALADFQQTITNIGVEAEKQRQDLYDNMFRVQEETAQRMDEFSQEALDLFDVYQQGLTDLQTENQEKRTALQEEYAAESIRLQDDFDRQRLQAEKDFQNTQEKAERDHRQKVSDLRRSAAEVDRQALEDYQLERQAAIEDFQKDELKRQGDYQLKRQRTEEKSRRDLIEAAGRLDAIAVLRILQDSQSSRVTDKTDFDRETQDRKAAYDQQLTDQREAFSRDGIQRRANLDQQIAEQKRAFEQQRREREGQFRDQQNREREQFDRLKADREQRHNSELAQARNAYLTERAERQAQFKDRLDQLMGWGKYEEETLVAHYQRLRNQLAVLAGSSNPGQQRYTTTPNTGAPARYGRQIEQFDKGGYTPDDIIRSHNDEWMANRQTTRALERAVGSRLTQQNVQQLVTHNNNARSIGDIHVNVTGTPAPGQVAQQVRRELTKVLTELGK